MKNDRKSFIGLGQNNGVTLIALIITVIVMLILAMVAISSINNGLIDKAKQAVGIYNNKVNEEESTYDNIQGMLENASNGGSNQSATGFFYTSGKNIISPTGSQYTIKAISIQNDVWWQSSWRNFRWNKLCPYRYYRK